jgi:hypothetical protein
MAASRDNLFAVVVADGDRFSNWEQECIRELQESGVTIVHFFFLKDRSATRRKDPGEFFFPSLFKKKTPLHSSFNGIPSASVSSLSDIEVNADFVLSFSSQSVPENMAAHGTWKFFFGDPEKNMNSHFYFEDVHANRTHCTLSLISEGAAQLLLRQVHFKTKLFSISRNAAFAESRARVLLRHAINDLRNKVAFRELSYPRSPVTSSPALSKLISLKIRLAIRMVRHRISHLFFADKWNIGVTRSGLFDPLTKQIPSAGISWMSEERGVSFNADPFAIETDRGLMVFCEFFDAAGRKGVICSSIFANGVFQKNNLKLEEDQHISYPFLLSSGDENFCVVESALQNQVMLYRMEKESYALSEEQILISGFPAVDPTLLFHNNKWWLFCTSALNKGADLDLYIFHADRLTGNYLPHARNPVKSDIRSARPAGSFFTQRGRLYRPAQDSSGQYGGRILIQEIKILSETDFEEQTVNILEPVKDSPYVSGIHTINMTSEWVVFDGKRRQLTLKNIFRRKT